MRTFKLIKKIPELNYKIGYILTIESTYIEYPMKHPNGHIIRNSNIKYDPATRPDLWKEIKEPILKTVNQQYKLLQQYPSCKIPIGALVDRRGASYYYGHTDIFMQNEVEQNPEFWQKVEEKDYEILSISYDNQIYNSYRDNPFGSECFIIKENVATHYEILLEEGFKIEIHSVKRLSDGEIFTIGDRIKEAVGYIDAFQIFANNELRLHVLKTDEDSGDREYFNISEVTKDSRQKLFTTEDGVDMYLEDKYVRIHKSSFEICHRVANKLDSTNENGFISFSTKEKAKEWIYQNKPRFSFNDIKTCYDRIFLTPDTEEEKENQKLNFDKLVVLLEKYCL